jgi:hypothetical protein
MRQRWGKHHLFEPPILNSRYEYPSRHWELDDQGEPTQRIEVNRAKIVITNMIDAVAGAAA